MKRAKQICERKTHTYDYSFSPAFERKLAELGIEEYAWDNEKKVFQIKLNKDKELLKYLEVRSEWEFWEKLNRASKKVQSRDELDRIIDHATDEFLSLVKRKYFAL